ncbi:MAG: response regulator transcription factor [Acidimicrobiia bacterium]
MGPAKTPNRSVLVVDDEPMVREVVGSYLSRDGFDVVEAADGVAAAACLRRDTPDLVVLDVMLPGLDGYSLLASISSELKIPVIMLTARSDEIDRVLGLELGADDYVVKPFSPRELSARVRAVLKRAGAAGREPHETIEVGELRIDARTREVWVSGLPVSLKPREFDLLLFLATNPRQVFSRGQLLEHVWDSHAGWQDPSTVTVHVRRVRQAIEDDPDSPQRLVTVWGVGYRLEI